MRRAVIVLAVLVSGCGGTARQDADEPSGDFKVEIDTKFLKDKQYEAPLRAVGVDPASTDTGWLERALLGVLSTVVPIEIADPPVPID